ncbi:hypothetical protein [Streptomyces sp. SID161]|uniref:hypothetical protein n=1 Tax=unclassified Streptomyces TaxID=2593676 RepID=UPI00136AE284|nr:hypothetical protein [Streptomyces sp. SID161]MYW44151.1 hypothetical protein [Streptomyces sp. SID161]
MSSQFWIYKFTDGNEDPIALDKSVVRDLFAPYDHGLPGRTVDADGNLQFWVRSADGSSAEVTVDEYCVSFDRPILGYDGHTAGVFAIAAEVATTLEAVIIDLSNGRSLCREEEYKSLPAAMRADALVIPMTGETLQFILTGARR